MVNAGNSRFVRPQPAYGLVIKKPVRETTSNVCIAFGIGMAVNLASIFVGNPYLISLFMIPFAVMMTLIWRKKPVSWIVLVSVIAANPINLNAPIAINLILALSVFLLSTQWIKSLPAWIFPLLLIIFLSILGSAANWNVTGDVLTQMAAIGNYIVGPFLLLPLVYSRLQQDDNSHLFIPSLILGFLLPSVLLIYLARVMGTPILDTSAGMRDGLINIGVLRLGNVDFQLTRTQVGIVLAAVICAAIAIFFIARSKKLRILMILYISLAIGLLLITGSIGSMIAALCGLIVILMTAPRIAGAKRYLVTLSILTCTLMIGWIILPQNIKGYAARRYGERFNTNSININDRIERWILALDYLKKNPSGQGWDLYLAPLGIYSHNDYLSYGIAFGVACGIIYLFIPLKVGLSLQKNRRHNVDSAHMACLLAGTGSVIVLLVNSFSDHLTANRWYFNIVWSLIWFCFFGTRRKNGNTGKMIFISGARN